MHNKLRPQHTPPRRLKGLPNFTFWKTKKQNSVVLSTAEAEYVVAGACCAQVLWIKHTLLDYDLHYDHVKIFCDNTSTIHMTKNANQHSKTKHIDIRYHFLRDHYEKGDIEMIMFLPIFNLRIFLLNLYIIIDFHLFVVN